MCYSVGFSASSIVTTNFVTGMTYRYDPNGENCEINNLGSTHPALGHANSLLFVIICGPALKLDVYAEVANSVTRSIKEYSSVYFTVYEYPHLPQHNIAMLYGTPSAIRPENS